MRKGQDLISDKPQENSNETIVKLGDKVIYKAETLVTEDLLEDVAKELGL